MKKALMALGCGAALMGSTVLAEVTLSERLTKIAKHLGDGGVHFLVTDSEDDLRDLAGLLDRFLEAVPEDEAKEIPAGFSFEQIFGDLGLLAIEGRGSSAHQVDDHWHNRSFLMTDGKHEGLLSLLGKRSEAPMALEFAPAGADLVLETTLDLTAFEATARKVVQPFGAEAIAEVEKGLKREIPELGTTLSEFMDDFKVRGTIVIWLDDEKTFELNPETKFPVPHFAAKMENAGTVWQLLEKELVAKSEVKEVDGQLVITPKDGPTPTPFGEILPQIVWNEGTGDLFLSLTPEDLLACLADGPKLGASPSFQQATKDFPETASTMAYVSSDFFRLVERLTKEFGPMAPPEGQEFIQEVLPYLEKLGTKGGYAAAFSVQEEGFLGAANFPWPVKGDSFMAGFGGLIGVPMIAGFATPAILKAKKSGDDTMKLNKAKRLAEMAITMDLEEGKFPTSLAELRIATAGDDFWIDFDEEEIVWVAKKAPTEAKEVVVYYLVPSKGQNIVGFADGSARLIPAEELELMLKK